MLSVKVEHNRPDNEHVQQDGTAWWHYAGIEFRLNRSGTQLAVTTWNNTKIGELLFGFKTVENEEGADYAYTTTYEVYFTGAYQGDTCALLIGGVYNDGFAWLFNGDQPAFNVTSTGLVKIY